MKRGNSSLLAKDPLRLTLFSSEKAKGTEGCEMTLKAEKKSIATKISLSGNITLQKLWEN